MRVLVIGASGMMGHMACRVLAGGHEVFGTVRRAHRDTDPLATFLAPSQWVAGVDVSRIDSVAEALARTRPDAVVNCVGIVKQIDAARDAVVSIERNALFPHLLARLCDLADARLVHLSTDCVFSGRVGGYTEDDVPDPVDLYGRSKLLGETEQGEGLTLRTSIVGRQLDRSTGLFEWALSNRGNTVTGFARAIYSGLTTMALARVIDHILERAPELTGVWHVASSPISKFDLLRMLNERLELDLTIERDESFVCDRGLDGSAFTMTTGCTVPGWGDMLDEFRDDQPAYAGLTESARVR